MNLIHFQEKDLWGFMNVAGEVIVSPSFLKVKPLNSGYFLVCTEKRPDRELYHGENIMNYKGDYDFLWGMINHNGDFVVEPKYTDLTVISGNYISAIRYAGPRKEWNDYCQNKVFAIYYNSTTSKELGRFREVSLMNNGFCLVETGRDPVGKDYCWLTYRIFNIEGLEVLSFSGGDSISKFENNIIKIGHEKATAFFDSDGKSLYEIPIGINNVSKNLGNYYILKENDSYFKLDLSSLEKQELSADISLVWHEIQSVYDKTSSSY